MMTEQQQTTNPYGSAFQAYWDRGWRSILHLPLAKKWPPPIGYTGRDAFIPSWADLNTWNDNGPGNLALRLGPGMIGIDVDAYGGKPGALTFDNMCTAFGTLPPTYLSTSRDDGVSGIRIYRIPEGIEFITQKPGVEIIQSHHRYVVAWPSLHPDGGTYRWLDESTGLWMTEPPNIADIPNLPDQWVQFLTATNQGGSDKPDLDNEQLRDVLEAFPTGEPCRHIREAAGKIVGTGARHDTYNTAALAVARFGRRGCPGAADALRSLGDLFVIHTRDRNTEGEARAEYWRCISGALAIVSTDPQGFACVDQVTEYVNSLDTTSSTTLEPAGTEVPEGTDHVEAAGSRQYEFEVQRELTTLRIKDEARTRFNTAKSAGVHVVDPIRLDTFLNQPDEDAQYRIDELWPAAGGVLLVAQAKTGKTTMVVGNIIPALVDDLAYPFLGRFNTTPIPEGRTVAYLNMELGEANLRRWLRKARITNTAKVVVVNLRGRASSFDISTPAGRTKWSAIFQAHGTDVVILDPLAPMLAALGLDENSNTDIATFWSWWGETLALAGIDDNLVVHHAGHGGERSRGASRLLDAPDAIWNLAVDRGDDDTAPRHLSALGRDVDLHKHQLDYNPDTGVLTLGDPTTKNTGGRPARRNLHDYTNDIARLITETPNGIGITTLKAHMPGSAAGKWERTKTWAADACARGWLVASGSGTYLPGPNFDRMCDQ